MNALNARHHAPLGAVAAVCLAIGVWVGMAWTWGAPLAADRESGPTSSRSGGDGPASRATPIPARPERDDPCAGPPVDGFDFPVGPPDGAGYRDAQPFGRNRHLGGDWNGLGGGNTDFGDPIFAIADGVVTSSRTFGGGWGLVVRVAHPIDGGCVESLYAHLSESAVARGQRIARGERIGAMGDADGVYSAHLHFELRGSVGMPLGAGYGDPSGYLDPPAFILEYRPLAASAGERLAR